MKVKKALLIVDVQNDFCPGGSLAVSEGDKVIPVLNKYIKFFSKRDLPIFASRDWHPGKTKHFKGSGGMWPVHCVQRTKGAGFHPDLQLPEEAIILSKGMDPAEDDYSAFQARDPEGNDFLYLLNSLQVKKLCVGGLATDYCVRASVLDALEYGFKIKLLMDVIRGVNEKDSRQAIKEMVAGGAEKVIFSKFL